MDSTVTGGGRLKFGHGVPSAVIPAFDDELRKTPSDPQVVLVSGIQQCHQISLVLGPRRRPRAA
jgi:hypothetical protein